MTQVFVGNIDASAENLLKRYLDKFYPDAEIQRLQAKVIRGKIRNQGARPTTALIVLDRNLYDRCKGFADEVLALPKTHLYESEPAFREFLKARFGCNEGSLNSVENKQGYAYASVSGTEDLGFSSNTDSAEESELSNLQSVTFVAEEKKSDTEIHSDADFADLQDKLVKAEERAAHFESELLTARTRLNNISNTEASIRDYQRDLNTANESVNSLKEQLSIKDDEIESLKSDLITAQIDASDASARLEEQKSYISGLELVSKRYNSLLPELESYKSRCAELEGKLDSLDSDDSSSDGSESYIAIKAERDGLRVEVGFLHEQITLKTKEVEEIKKSAKQSVVDEITKLKSDLEDVTSRAESLQVSVESKDDRIRELIRELTQAKADMSGLRDDIEASDTLLSNKTNDLKDANNTIAELRATIDDLRASLVDFESTKQRLIDAERCVDELKARVSDYEELKAKLNDAEGNIVSLNSSITELTASLAKSNEDADKYLAKRNELSATVKELKAQLGTAQSDKDELESTKILLEDSRATITGLTTDIGILKDKLEDSEDLVKSLQSQLDKQSQSSDEAVKGLEDDKHTLQEQINALTSQVESSSDELTKSQLLIEDYKSQLVKAQSAAVGFEDQLKLERENTGSLREQLGEAQVKLQAYEQNAETVDGLQSKVSELELAVNERDEKVSSLTKEKDAVLLENSIKQEKIVELEAVVESLSNDKATHAGDMSNKDAEITRLKAQLKALADSAVSTDSADTLRKQLDSAIELNTKLKDALEESSNNLTSLKEASESRLKAALDTNKALRQKINTVNMAKDTISQQLNTLRKNPFYLLGVSSDSLSMLPKPISLGSAFYDNIFAFASGSGESIDELFSLFQRQVAVNGKKSFLIIDLSVESVMTKYFKVSSVPSPEQWLLGNEPITSCAASCLSFSNVRLVSTGFAYFNALCLLKIDWKKKLEELKGLADYVFINVGCLIDNIGAILFDTFLSVMNGHIIIRGTPRSVRSLTLRVVAMQNRVNALVSSVRVELKDDSTYQTYQNELAQLQRCYDTLGSYCDLSVITSKDVLEI